MEALTTAERGTLQAYEAVIEKGLASFVEVGNALMRIRDGNPPLYRETHKTFEEYCRERWQFTDNYARRLMSAASVVESVPMGTVRPATEREARPLTLLETPKEQQLAWKEVVKTAPKNHEGEPIITARHVEEVVRERIGEKEPDAQRGKSGGPTQWDRLTELNLKARSYFEQLVAERRDNPKSEAVLNAYETLESLIASYRKSVSRIGA